MSLSWLAVLLATLAAASAYNSTMPAGEAIAQNRPASRSVWDGIYTDDQAKRGDEAYQEKCAPCHEMNLSGGTMGPPIAGAPFLNGWHEKDLHTLFDLVRTTMPADNPGTLSPETYVGILAFVLKSNGFPAGTADLTADVEALKQIRIERNPKPTAAPAR